MAGVFITGTDTDVGKTFIAAAIVKQLTKQNITVIPKKPIESGCIIKDGELFPQDAATLQRASNYSSKLSDVCPYRFQPAISPARAAQLENITLSTEDLSRHCRHDNDDDFLLVEGAGGFYSPLVKDGLNADLAITLQLPVLLIANDKLGTLNHVLLTIEAIENRGLILIGVVLNDANNSNNEHMDNVNDLREQTHHTIFSCPFSDTGETSLPEELLNALTEIKMPAT